MSTEEFKKKMVCLKLSKNGVYLSKTPSDLKLIRPHDYFIIKDIKKNNSILTDPYKITQPLDSVLTDPQKKAHGFNSILTDPQKITLPVKYFLNHPRKISEPYNFVLNNPQNITQSVKSVLTNTLNITRSVNSALTDPEKLTKSVNSVLTDPQKISQSVNFVLTDPQKITQSVNSVLNFPQKISHSINSVFADPVKINERFPKVQKVKDNSQKESVLQKFIRDFDCGEIFEGENPSSERSLVIENNLVFQDSTNGPNRSENMKPGCSVEFVTQDKLHDHLFTDPLNQNDNDVEPLIVDLSKNQQQQSRKLFTIKNSPSTSVNRISTLIAIDNQNSISSKLFSSKKYEHDKNINGIKGLDVSIPISGNKSIQNSEDTIKSLNRNFFTPKVKVENFSDDPSTLPLVISAAETPKLPNSYIFPSTKIEIDYTGSSATTSHMNEGSSSIKSDAVDISSNSNKTNMNVKKEDKTQIPDDQLFQVILENQTLPCLNITIQDVDAAQQDVIRAAKALYSKRTRTLFHWINPRIPKAKLKDSVMVCWELLPTWQKQIYINQVIGKYGRDRLSPMVNPQIMDMERITETLLSPQNNDRTQDSQPVKKKRKYTKRSQKQNRPTSLINTFSP